MSTRCEWMVQRRYLCKKDAEYLITYFDSPEDTLKFFCKLHAKAYFSGLE